MDGLLHMQPDLETVFEELTLNGVDCRLTGRPGDRRFTDARRYRPGLTPDNELLYVARYETGSACGTPDGAKIIRNFLSL